MSKTFWRDTRRTCWQAQGESKLGRPSPKMCHAMSCGSNVSHPPHHVIEQMTHTSHCARLLRILFLTYSCGCGVFGRARNPPPNKIIPSPFHCAWWAKQIGDPVRPPSTRPLLYSLLWPSALFHSISYKRSKNEKNMPSTPPGNQTNTLVAPPLGGYFVRKTSFLWYLHRSVTRRRKLIAKYIQFITCAEQGDVNLTIMWRRDNA
jgi:hypothetical protein